MRESTASPVASGDPPAAKALRIAVVSQRDEGGATVAAREILAWGPARGLEVLLLPDDMTSSTPGLQKALARFSPQVVHMHCWYRDFPYELLSVIAGAYPTVLTVHDVFPINQYGSECWECYRNPYCFGCPALEPLRRWRPNYRILDRLRKRRRNRQTSCHLVFPSLWMKRRFSRSEWRRLPSSVIPYGVDTAHFAPGPPERESFRLPKGPLVLFAGNMYGSADHRKGLPDLMVAFARVREGIPDAGLALAGRLVARDPVPGVVVLGEIPRERLPALYRSADLFCIPSRGDNLPVAVLEAMAAGLPVVGTRVGGIPEQVEQATTGLLIPPSDPESLATALTALLVDAKKRGDFGRAARARALRLFSREASATMHEALYRHLASGS